MNKIILLLTFVKFSTISFTQSNGDLLFSDLKIHTIELNFSQADYWNTLKNNKAYDDSNDSSSYLPALVNIDGILLDSVGIQFKGNSSYYNYPTNKKPFTLSIDEYKKDQNYDGLKSINLNNGYQDPTMMREKLFLDFLNEKELYAPRGNYAKLYINGSYWGLYLIVERVNKTFCKDRFGNNDGNLFKGDKGSSACAKLEYHGVLSPYYNCYTLKTNTKLNDWSDLINLTYQIYKNSGSEFSDSVSAVLNTNSFIGAWAACNLFADFDSYSFRYQHNYYVYHNTKTNKFEWITWDVSTAFGIDIPQSISQIESNSVLYLTPPAKDKPLSNRMLMDSVFTSTYLNTICNYANENFKPSVLFPKIDNIKMLIDSAYYADSLKMYSNQNFKDNIENNINLGFDLPGLKSFITNRRFNVLNELNSLNVNCSNTGTSIPGLNKSESISIYPNPASKDIIIKTLVYIQNPEILVYNLFGDIQFQNSLIGVNNFDVDISKLPAGIYFIRINSGEQSYFSKFIKL